MCIEWEFGALSPRWDLFIKSPIQRQESLWKRRQKDCKPEEVDDPQENVSPRHNRSDAKQTLRDGDSTYKTHTSINQTKFQHRRGEESMKFYSWEAVCSSYTLGKKMMCFFNGVSLVYDLHCRVGSVIGISYSAPTDSMAFVCFCFVLEFLLLFFLREKEHEVG